ncbi:hypothetical protein FB562_1638 [Homoserinimonas aerilata]|uniref:Uncharacterized protein n=1 Tax=Homoserinimonas aerilata TaxID=1162970 RepID=A0A542YKB4_9MICO|nr:hypothetical protein [Homoserinimonas aerilata]TQL48543.1 hypothetical protein FB562_1638 [Homoserinimonas aerilata]
MTTAIETKALPQGGGVRRIINVTRMQLINRFSLLVLPWMILGFIFIVNLAVWWLIMTNVSAADRADASDGMQFSGATGFIFVYMLVVAVQSVNLTFPFALGFSATRRDFYFGSLVLFVIMSAYYGLGMTILAAIERATDGWGFGGRMFDVLYFQAPNPVMQFVLFFVLFLFFFLVGAGVSAVYVRWRSNGMIVFWALFAVLLIGAAALITFTQNWVTVGQWFVEMGPFGVVMWSLLPSTLIAISGYFLLQKATPKS